MARTVAVQLMSCPNPLVLSAIKYSNFYHGWGRGHLICCWYKTPQLQQPAYVARFVSGSCVRRWCWENGLWPQKRSSIKKLFLNENYRPRWPTSTRSHRPTRGSRVPSVANQPMFLQARDTFSADGPPNRYSLALTHHRRCQSSTTSTCPSRLDPWARWAIPLLASHTLQWIRFSILGIVNRRLCQEAKNVLQNCKSHPV